MSKITPSVKGPPEQDIAAPSADVEDFDKDLAALEDGTPSIKPEKVEEPKKNTALKRGVSQRLNVAVPQMREFQHMHQRAMPLNPILKWNTEEWEEALGRDAEEFGKLLAELEISSTSREGIAQVQKKLSVGLTDEQWQTVVRFQHTGRVDQPEVENEYYLSNEIAVNALFDREFPMGIDKRCLEGARRWKFAVSHSGNNEAHHKQSKTVDILVWASLAMLVIMAVIFLVYNSSKSTLWCLECTDQTVDPDKITGRTQDRGTVASILSALTFSLVINASLDKFGKIEPSTSTVFIGMTLGGTWGFILDNMLGSDEGMREYLFDPFEGMKYALGSLASGRYGRYLITIVFDMFFSVILFKYIYSRLVHIPGLSKMGNEWMANGFSSFFISFITYQVYANMTRFQWAYPSGDGGGNGNWISGSTMILATISMNMVYLVSETRLQMGEPGINDPSIKLLVTILTFCMLWGLQFFNVMEAKPSVATGADIDYAPLPGVCATMADWRRGLLIFITLSASCLGFVIFVTSKSTLDEVLTLVSCGRIKKGAFKDKSAKFKKWVPKLILWVFAFAAVMFILIFFSFVPFWSSSTSRIGTGCANVTIV